jgi:hypothetical protein
MQVSGSDQALTPEVILKEWLRRTRRAQCGHYKASQIFKVLGYLTGAPPVILTALGGAAASTALASEDLWPGAQIFIAIVSAIAAVLSGIQLYFQFGTRAERHRAMGAKQGALRRRIEESLGLQGISIPLSEVRLMEIRKDLDLLAAESDPIPSVIWKLVDDGAR